MENRIPIDELFHDKLYEGKERMSLSAWDNMERMLDGKNPYASDEEKKRRLFPFWLVFLASIAIVGAGYLFNTNVRNKMASDQSTFEAQSINETSSTQPVAFVNSTSSIANERISTSQSSSISHSANQPSYPTVASSARKLNQTVAAKITLSASTSAANPTKNSSDHESRSTTQPVAPNKMKGNIAQQSASNTQSVKSVALHKKMKTNLVDATSISKVEEATNKDEAIIGYSTDSSAGLTPETVTEKIPVVTIKQKTIRKRDGSIQEVLGDTVGKSVIEKEIDRPVEVKATASLHPMMTNPRFKKLSQEEEEQANFQKPQAVVSQKETVLASASPSVNVTAEISIAASQKSSAVKQTGYFEDLKKFATETYRTISNFFLFNPKPDTYPGLSMGMNASLSNANRNFGGFQGGFTTLNPITDFVSFLAELKFYYRNNGGYTATDVNYKIVNPTADTATLSHVQSTIYSYQKDSTVKTYNFKNFYSLELPLIAQLNYRSFALYGGLNLAYNFRLKTTEKSRNYAVSYIDTVATSVGFDFPIDKASQYMKSDFSSRFGLGYTLGAAYSFSPQLYIDLRITQNVWDNMKTNAAREISNGFFKVPSFQFSLGYRFRKFTPDN
jgi:hypothetical protein